MLVQSTISAFQTVLSEHEFTNPSNFAEEFAQNRYRKKMERPILGRDKELADEAWRDYLSFDSGLPTEIILPHPLWYRARILIHQWCGGYAPSSAIEFPKGSSFEATRGLNSIESWLSRNGWTVTPDAFDKFAESIYTHKALKRAFRRRYNRWYQRKDFDITSKEADRMLWNHFKNPKQIFKWKLERVVKFVRGSRFSTVPKNNTQRRPINIEPFGNILEQRRIGIGFRDTLKRELGIDLLVLADVHKERIADGSIATIDLKNASDAVSLALVRFLFPARIVKLIEAVRSPLLLGHDGEYHIPKKVSSMGNGFTFELMTMILTALCRTLDSNATVFGDDIIIDKTKALQLIEALSSVGFVVNKDKSFVDGPFRESCGGNYLDGHGYIESFDFLYPESIADCCVLYNKTKHLASSYPSFALLEKKLLSKIPRALRGGSLESVVLNNKWDVDVELPTYFATGHGIPIPAYRLKRNLQVKLVKKFKGFRNEVTLKSHTLSELNPNWHWGKYEMYLASGSRADDVKKGRCAWVSCDFLEVDGRNFLASSLKVHMNRS